jgi:hypothetical protein
MNSHQCAIATLLLSILLTPAYAQCNFTKDEYDGVESLTTDLEMVGDYNMEVDGQKYLLRIWSQAYTLNKGGGYGGTRVTIRVDSYINLNAKAVFIDFISDRFRVGKEPYFTDNATQKTDKRIINDTVFWIEESIGQNSYGTKLSYDEVKNIKVGISSNQYNTISLESGSSTIMRQVECLDSVK